MKLPQLNTGMRVMASFALLLLAMACMSGVSLWRLQSANDTASNLVDEKLAKQQLTSELLGVAELNGLRTISIARSDSLEVADIFQAQLAAGDKLAAAMERQLAAMPADDAERGLLGAAGARRTAYLALRADLFKLKDGGRIQEVGEMLDTRLAAAFAAYTGALQKLLDYQTREARALAAASASQFHSSRALLIGLGAATLALGAGLAVLLTRSIVRPLTRAVALAGRVAGGELHVVIEHGRADEIGQLFDALSHMTDRLAHTVGRVRDGAVAIDSASREIANGNLDLSRRTEHQAGALQETASAMVQLASAVRENSGNAREANALALSASEVAGKGGQVVSEVVRTMAGINDYAHKIVDITGVIDSIAFQTNILALNAAVEAARAGEQGRGFAVVASEVRGLAQRSAAAAREIKALINDSAGQIASGSALAENAGATMDEIMLSVRKVTAIMASISAASAEQEHGIGQVAAAIGEMDGVTQQNAALVEEAAAAAAAMQAQARELTQLVGAFKTRGTTTSNDRRHRAGRLILL
ncbi:MAG TPA: methyl-accepting chemotaxis protein [Duganella sp.]|uniref:methyl-accepting chemotaxis protein n=1 Tax=Duganella sp. TaxID=1904440 RepID=UPI002ED34FAF